MQTVTVNRRGAARVEAAHPWIFRSDLLDTGESQPGDAVRVVAGKRVLGTGHYSSTSQIALRMLSKDAEEIDSAFFRHRLLNAAALRAACVANTNALRLVHAEADGLPALIIDRYGDHFVVQTLNQGMDRATDLIVEALTELFAPAGILARNDAGVRSLEDLPREVRILRGSFPESIPIEMNGLHFAVDPQRGMKTGVFLDQRENYAAVARYGRGMALDCFTSTGGFALHLARHCSSVEAIDSSDPALAVANGNASLNGIGNIRFREADVFEALAQFAAARRAFDVVVLDPPAFAKSRGHVDAARRAYKEINRRAIGLLAPGGILVSCSCSHHVSEADLLEVIAEASVEAKRTLRIRERRTQSGDHPILLTVPETLYLKCLILEDAPF